MACDYFDEVPSLQMEAVNLIGIEATSTDELTFVRKAHQLVRHFRFHHPETFESFGIESPDGTVQRTGHENTFSIVEEHRCHLTRMTLHVSHLILCAELGDTEIGGR